MRITDLGTLDGPVLLFGGVYGNLQALTAVMATARALNATPVCTGDVLAYCADGEACATLMRHRNIACIAGNCEQNLAGGADDCGCGFVSGSACDRLSAAWFAHAQATVSAASLGWMRQLPTRITFCHNGRRYGVLHGGADDIAGFVWPGSGEIGAQIRLAKSQIDPLDYVVAGHCGLAFRQYDWVNAGAIGMPPNDGNSATRYAVLDRGALRFARLDYDVEAAQNAMRAAGLVQGYDGALASGFWPSEDVLPPRLRRFRQRGPFIDRPV